MATGDLISLATAQSELAASLPSDQSALPSVISAASRAIQRYCGRRFVVEDYDECYDSPGYNALLLRQYPVNSISRLAVAPTVALTVTNADAATNQRALARLATTGDVDAGLTVTGLTLTRVASGVTTTNESGADPIPFATYKTIQSLADFVNGLGNGWVATAAPGYGLWATADLRAVQGNQNALTSPASFVVHAQDLSGWTLHAPSGEIRVGATGFDPVFALMNLSAGQINAFPVGWQNVRVAYNAGYATVPADVQQACLVAVLEWMHRLQKIRIFKTEKAKDYSYEFFESAGGLPAESLAILKSGGWRSYRRS